MSFLYDKMAGLVRKAYDSRISGPPTFDMADHFPGSTRLVEAWQTLRDEALAIGKTLTDVPRFHELMREQSDISDNDGRDWRMFVVKAYGLPMTRNMARCPALVSLLASMPEVLTATISFLAPNKHIPLHRGPFRGVIRYYLGLSVPVAADGQPATVLRIADTDYRIGNGECLLWDDTYPHEVWNQSNEVRIALLLDIRRRGMPFDMELLTKVLIGAVQMLIRLKGRQP
ncbi:MAG: aspartyl/asparaginyl beta-hydroxylase domain-containing protein [Parasulfuritortus sp.]|jgi:aspartate beta-hydroxylase|nr:aspartyl/asparaginyl beta-hydroxylase domain-containing protein [Parasulfuritortus sp.]